MREQCDYKKVTPTLGIAFSFPSSHHPVFCPGMSRLRGINASPQPPLLRGDKGGICIQGDKGGYGLRGDRGGNSHRRGMLPNQHIALTARQLRPICRSSEPPQGGFAQSSPQIYLPGEKCAPIRVRCEILGIVFSRFLASHHPVFCPAMSRLRRKSIPPTPLSKGLGGF